MTAASPAPGAPHHRGRARAGSEPDFPDVTISKIRFLEAEGLVTPARTASGYRTFTDRRRRAAALRAARPARPVLAAEGDQATPSTRIDRGLHRRATPATAAPSRPPPTADPDVPDAADLAARRDLRLTARRAARGPPGWRPAERRRPRDATACCGPTPPGCTTTSRRCRSPTPRPALAAYGVEPRHLRPLPHRRRPRDRPGRAGRRPRARAVPDARERATPPRSLACASPCTPPWSVPGCPAARADRRRRCAGYGDAMKVLDVLGVRVEMPTNQPIVLLRERDGDRYLPIWIGAAEATAIAYAQQGVVPPRPLTHDLLRTSSTTLGHELTRGAHRRAQGRRLPRDARSSTGAAEVHRHRVALVRRDRPGPAHRRRDRRRGGAPRRGRASRWPETRTTRSRSSRSSSTTSRPRTSSTEADSRQRLGDAAPAATRR